METAVTNVDSSNDNLFLRTRWVRSHGEEVEPSVESRIVRWKRGRIDQGELKNGSCWV